MSKNNYRIQILNFYLKNILLQATARRGNKLCAGEWCYCHGFNSKIMLHPRTNKNELVYLRECHHLQPYNHYQRLQ